MRVLRPRSRIVSIRMSEEEFSTLRRICVATGARSVSDLAREAMRGLLNGAKQESSGDGSHNQYSAQMRSLEQKVDQLSAEVALFKADRNLWSGPTGPEHIQTNTGTNQERYSNEK